MSPSQKQAKVARQKINLLSKPTSISVGHNTHTGQWNCHPCSVANWPSNQLQKPWGIIFEPNSLTVDFGDVKTAPIECKEKCFQMSLSSLL